MPEKGPPKQRLLSTVNKLVDPVISCDPLWTEDLIVTFRMRYTQGGYQRPTYGDLCAGWYDPEYKQVRFTNFICVNIVKLDDELVDVSYRATPGAMMYSWPSLSSIQFPDILTDIGWSMSPSVGDGSSSHPASNQKALAAGAGSISLNPRAQAQCSAAIVADVQPAIKQIWSRDLPTMNYAFYIPVGSTIDAVLSRLTTAAGAAVLAMPVFQPQTYWLSAVSERLSGSLEADSFATISTRDGVTASALAYEWGNGTSQEVGITVKNTRVGPVINGNITLSISGNTATASCSADASTVAMPSSGTAIIPAITNTPTSLSLVATGSVSPTTFAATTPADIPRTGLYMTELNPSIHDDRLLLVHAAVVDFSIFNGA